MSVVYSLCCHTTDFFRSYSALQLGILLEDALVKLNKANKHVERVVFVLKPIGLANDFPRAVSMKKIIPKITLVLQFEYLEIAERLVFAPVFENVDERVDFLIVVLARVNELEHILLHFL